MPELPEVESIRRSLGPHVLGARVIRAALHRPDICEAFNGSGEHVATTPQRLLQGGTIERTARHGKQLAFVDDRGRVLLVHLGMSGQLLVGASAGGLTHVHAAWNIRPALSGPDRPDVFLVFRDPRRFGGLWTFPCVEDLYRLRWNALGPDALGAEGAHIFRSTRGTRRCIKSILLDQSIIAGIGNIYADESLFAAGIAPNTAAGRLKLQDCERMTRTVRSILTAAIEAGGSTLRDYVNADGRPGTAAANHAVYGRGGQPCFTCGNALSQTTLGQRTTVWCRTCQRKPNAVRKCANSLGNP